MARRVFLHVGTAKSGTSFLQDLWWQQRDDLRDRGLLLPGNGRRDHFAAAALVKGMTDVVATFGERELGAWQRLVDETGSWSGDVLISNEHFADSPPDAARGAVAELAAVADEVHVVVTARDLGRVLPSAWQQRVKMGARQPYRRFLGGVRNPAGDDKFWRYQDVPQILGRWAADLPGDRVHVVVVPAPGAPRDELWHRTSSVLGADVSGLTTEATRPNDSLGVVEAELLRRVNDAVPRERRTAAYSHLVKRSFVPEQLVGSAPRDSFAVPEQHLAWVGERSAEVVAALRASAYDVVGDLDDLLPRADGSGRTPDQLGDAELADAAAVVLQRGGVDAPGSLEEAVGLIADDLLTRVAQREPQRGTNAQ